MGCFLSKIRVLHNLNSNYAYDPHQGTHTKASITMGGS